MLSAWIIMGGKARVHKIKKKQMCYTDYVVSFDYVLVSSLHVLVRHPNNPNANKKE